MDLSNAQNWSTVYSSRLRAQVLATTQYGGIEHSPLANIEMNLASPIGIVNLYSSYVHPATKRGYIGVGCYLDAYLPLSGIRTKVYSRKCIINEGTFLQLPNFGVYPYRLELSFPYCISQIDVEIKQFIDQSGRYLDQDEAVVYTAVEVVEQRLQELDQIVRQSQGT